MSGHIPDLLLLAGLCILSLCDRRKSEFHLIHLLSQDFDTCPSLAPQDSILYMYGDTTIFALLSTTGTSLKTKKEVNMPKTAGAEGTSWTANSEKRPNVNDSSNNRSHFKGAKLSTGRRRQVIHEEDLPYACHQGLWEAERGGSRPQQSGSLQSNLTGAQCHSGVSVKQRVLREPRKIKEDPVSKKRRREGKKGRRGGKAPKGGLRDEDEWKE
ncbi:hypothetical protein EI94DRAFT_1697849 [Lactarius quietus]|nr:hypothetical protein EI94DRAFT_1697849 [Lactarius quietus]